MKFDTIIIGGGLSSLVCGISLQKAGRRCLMVSSGQNALHFSSGTFGLLGKLPDGTTVTEPLAALPSLPPGHPYSKIGLRKVSEYAASIPAFFADCGIGLSGVPAPGPGWDGQGGRRGKPEGLPGAIGGERDSRHGMPSIRNGWRLTPLGTLKPAWLAMKEVTLLASRDEVIASKTLIVNFAGFLDLNTRFIAEGLEKRGTGCRIEMVKIPEVENLRKNPSEMRSVNIARVMNKEENWKAFGRKVRSLIQGEDLVILPEVFGLEDQIVTEWLREMVPAKVMFVGTMPPSVPGIRTQMLLKKAFESAGGTFLMGDEAIDPTFEGDKVLSVRTANLGSIRLEADDFVLASGNLFGKGLVASPDRVVEPVFGLDVDYPAAREDWYDEDFFARQDYAGFGVRTDASFKPYKGGMALSNLYVIGAELGGCNPLYEGSGAGIAMLSALSVAGQVLSD